MGLFLIVFCHHFCVWKSCKMQRNYISKVDSIQGIGKGTIVFFFSPKLDKDEV